MGRFQRSISLFKSSWAVVRTDRELLLLPVVSALVSLVVMASFAVPAWLSLKDTTTIDAYGNTTSSMAPTALTYVLGALFYFCSAFVVIFFNAALISGANERFEGGDPTIGSALAGAWSRVGLILQWSAVSATVSLIIRQIQERGGLLGKIVGGLIGFAWAVVTFLVLPTLVIEGVGVREAFRRSTDSIRTTWGENLIGQGGIGLLGLVAVLPCLFVGAIGVVLMGTSVVLGLALIAIAVIGILAASVLLSATGVVYQTALYRYATHRPISGFEQEALAGAFRQKPASRWGR
ncbi:MAG: DUF6159 family protein [Acidimicrobiales bacterium]